MFSGPYKGVEGAILVFDAANFQLAQFSHWITHLEAQVDYETPLFVVINKVDLAPSDAVCFVFCLRVCLLIFGWLQLQVIDLAKISMQTHCSSDYGWRCFSTSAKTGHGVQELFDAMVTAVKTRRKRPQPQWPSKFTNTAWPPQYATRTGW